MKTIAFFNNKGGVGKTSLVYHLAWMYADRGLRVLVADLDPQANLTAMFIDDDRLKPLVEKNRGHPGASCRNGRWSGDRARSRQPGVVPL